MFTIPEALRGCRGGGQERILGGDVKTCCGCLVLSLKGSGRGCGGGAALLLMRTGTWKVALSEEFLGMLGQLL